MAERDHPEQPSAIAPPRGRYPSEADRFKPKTAADAHPTEAGDRRFRDGDRPGGNDGGNPAKAGRHPAGASRPRGRSVLVCGFLLTFACFLGMIYRYQVPSMWVDEILVALSTRLDVIDIVNRYWHQDFHPPYYALLLKAISVLSDSDVSLRLPSLVCAVAGVLVGFAMAARWGNPVGMCYLALCLGNLWIWLFARQARPYGITILLATYTFFATLDVARQKRVNSAAYGLANFLLLLVHYANALVVLPQFVLVAFASAKGSGPNSRRLLIALSAAGATGLAAVLPFYLATQDIWISPRPLSDRAERFFVNLTSITTGLPTVESTATFAVGALAASILVFGLIRFIRDHRLPGIFTAAFLLIPSAYIVLPSRQYGEFQAWHLSIILPALLFCLAYGTSLLPLRNAWILAILGCGLANIHDKSDILYTEYGAKGIYKTVAGMIAARNQTGAVYSLSQDVAFHATEWYLDHLHPAVSLYRATLDPDQEVVRFVVISGVAPLPGVIDAEEAPVLRAHFPNVVPRAFSFKTQKAIGQSDEYVLRWHEKLIRRPLVNALRPGSVLDFSRDPETLLKGTRHLEGVALKPNILPPNPGCAAEAFYFFPASPDSPGRVSFLFANPEGIDRADFEIRYFLNAPGEVGCFVSIDGGRPEAIFMDQDAENAEKTVTFRRDLTHVRRIELIVSMRCFPFPYPGVFPNARIGLNAISVRN